MLKRPFDFAPITCGSGWAMGLRRTHGDRISTISFRQPACADHLRSDICGCGVPVINVSATVVEAVYRHRSGGTTPIRCIGEVDIEGAEIFEEPYVRPFGLDRRALGQEKPKRNACPTLHSEARRSGTRVSPGLGHPRLMGRPRRHSGASVLYASSQERPRYQAPHLSPPPRPLRNSG